MKATIKGRVYDTNKATLIAKVDNGFCPMDERYMEERLYQKADGEYFVYGHGGSMSPYGKREGTKMVGTVHSNKKTVKNVFFVEKRDETV